MEKLVEDARVNQVAERCRVRRLSAGACLGAILAVLVASGQIATYAQPIPYSLREDMYTVKAGKWKETTHFSAGEKILVHAQYRWWGDGPPPRSVYFEVKRRPRGRYFPSSPSIFRVKLGLVRHRKGDDTFRIRTRLPRVMPTGQVLIVFAVYWPGRQAPMEIHVLGWIMRK